MSDPIPSPASVPAPTPLTSTGFITYRRQLLSYLAAHAPDLFYHLYPSPALEPYRKTPSSLVHLVEMALFRPWGQFAGDHPPCAMVSVTGLRLSEEQFLEWAEWARCERSLRKVFRKTFSPDMWEGMGNMWSTKDIWETLEAEYIPSPVERQSHIIYCLRSTRLPPQASLRDIFKLWDTFNLLVIEARDAGLFILEEEVVDRYLGAIGKGDAGKLVRATYGSMSQDEPLKGTWRGVRRVVRMCIKKQFDDHQLAISGHPFPIAKSSTLMAPTPEYDVPPSNTAPDLPPTPEPTPRPTTLPIAPHTYTIVDRVKDRRRGSTRTALSEKDSNALASPVLPKKMRREIEKPKKDGGDARHRGGESPTRGEMREVAASR
ncbi:hypothetical protein L202_02496 [Cryptococcus amylolentus CBS 6039]|uniref:Uncharacterized protein n=1 Tax=Cryptococcus amylolentus CBS 6039 TaxID=1295533 RepID=A0A1E3I124_9TREE|nr:hypothetical protein L202_02496 [Cryptococcus amylolentus CBS 6039]ODN82208.1 hypothetical protein L202_02496 [Cryptococcus amylolentus CBS 6039]